MDFVYDSFYASVSRGGGLIHLKRAPKTVADRAHRKEHEHLDAYVAVAGVEALYQELQSREDADGYILCFSEETVA